MTQPSEGVFPAVISFISGAVEVADCGGSSASQLAGAQLESG